jgi:hypothetical protein
MHGRAFHKFPAEPARFLPISTETKTRVFLQRAGAFGERQQLEPVTTLNVDSETAGAIVDALNHAAWTGRTAPLEAAWAGLPDAVVQSCRQSLASCPPPHTLAMGQSGAPMNVVGQAWFNDPDEVATYFAAAMEVGLQAVVENRVNRDQVEYATWLLSEDATVDAGEVGSWAPPLPWTLTERHHPVEGDLVKAFSDARWASRRSRAYWLWVRDADRPTSAVLEVVFEHFDEPLSPAFHVDDDLGTAPNRHFLTTRNRFMLHMSLLNIVIDLDDLVADWPENDSTVYEDMPALVKGQPREWWMAMLRSAERLHNAARNGSWIDLVPRTPAEEALLFLATTDAYIEWAEEVVPAYERSDELAALPVHEDDGLYDELLPALTGDLDIEMLWDEELTGIEDPEHPLNLKLHIGDYRPAAWHRYFERAVRAVNPADGLADPADGDATGDQS